MSSATSISTSGYSDSDSNSSAEVSGVVGGSPTRDQAATGEKGDDDDDEDDRDVEGLALSSPERSPAPSEHRGSSSVNSNDVGGDGNGSNSHAAAAGISAEQQQEQRDEQQQQTATMVPYIKTLEEIYRVVDSLTNSPVDAAAAAAAVGTNTTNTNTNITERRRRDSHHHHQQQQQHTSSFDNDNPDADSSSDSSDSDSDADIIHHGDDDDDGFYDIPIPRSGPDATCPACATPYDIAAADPISIPTSSSISISSSLHPHHNLLHHPFRSTLRLLYNDPLKHTWALGSRLVVTETDSADDSQPGGPEVALAEAARMLRATTRVPVPEVLAAWKEGDGRVVTVCERVGGGGGTNGGNGWRQTTRTSRLYDVWWEITPVERERLARRVAGYAEQWRRNYSDAISSISGYPIVRGYETLLGSGRGVCYGGYEDDGGGGDGSSGMEDSGEGFPHCRSDIEFWGAIEERLQRLRRRRTLRDKDRHRHRHRHRQKNGKMTIDADDDDDETTTTMRVLKEYMPESYPCVLTHGDLSTRNILVEMTPTTMMMNNGGGATGVEVAAILGFENAASLPVWAEGVCARFCYCREDEQWKALLSRYLPSGNPAAFDWWRLWRAVRGDDDDAVAAAAAACGGGDAVRRFEKVKEARIRMLRERCRRWPKPPQERRAFNAARTEPGARQVPRREPATPTIAATPVTAEKDGDEEGRAKHSPVAAQPLREEDEEEDASTDLLSYYRSRRESLDLRSPGLRRPVFNPEPIRFSDPERDGGGGGDDGREANGDITSPVVDCDGDKPTDLLLAQSSEPNITSETRERDVRDRDVGGRQLDQDDGEELGEQVDNGKERPLDRKETELLRDKRATWHTSKFMEGNGFLIDHHNDSTEPTNTIERTDSAKRPRTLARSQDTSPNPSEAERDQRTRGRPLQRNNSTKRTSMRSFGPQVTLQPLTLQPLHTTTAGRPPSLPPVANAISAADMEKLRSIGENHSNHDGTDGKGADENDRRGPGDNPPGLGDQGTEGEAPSSTNTNTNAGDALPVIREHPATPRRPMIRGPSGSRVRPASLYGTLQAWGQKNRAATAAGGTGSGPHKRARSELVLLRSDPSPQGSLRSHRTTVIRAPPDLGPVPERAHGHDDDVGIYDHSRPGSRALSADPPISGFHNNYGDRSGSRGPGRGGGITWDTNNNNHDPRKNDVGTVMRSRSHG